MADSYQPTYWVDKSTPSLNAANLRKLEKGIADAHGIADGTIGSTGAVDRIVINDGAGHYLQIPSLTTAQRDALTAKDGMLLYNTTLGCFQARRGGAWVDLHAGTVRDGLNLNGKRVQNVGWPTSDTDAATKAYVDQRPASSIVAANAYLSGSTWYRTDPAKPAWIVEVDANTDLCRFRRAPPGSGAISWTDVCQVGAGGLRPRICVASSEIRHESLAAVQVKSGSSYPGDQALKTYRIPAGGPYYMAGHYQMTVRVTASVSVDTYYEDKTVTLQFYVAVDGVERWSTTVPKFASKDISADVPVNPHSVVTLGVRPYECSSGYFGFANASNFRISATDIYADSAGW